MFTSDVAEMVDLQKISLTHGLILFDTHESDNFFGPRCITEMI